MSNRKFSESSSSGSESGDEEIQTIQSEAVLNKYNFSAEIVNAVLKEVIANVKEGVEVATLCDLGDSLIKDKTSKVFKKEKNMPRGIGMPTCVSVDNVICHFSPLKSDPPVVLKNGQIVKIDLGAHIDGFIATAAHTVVVGASKDNKVTGKKADVIKAAHDALEIAIRTLRVGNDNFNVTAAIDKTAAAYGVTPIENMVSHSLEKDRIDGEKQIIQNAGEKEKGELLKTKVEEYEVYAIDVLFSTGAGKPKDQDTRTTVFKKQDDVQYSLKMKASRIFFSELSKNHGAMPFTLRSFEDEVKAKMGVVECERHGLVRPYQVLYEREGDFVAQFKATVMVLPTGLLKITGLPLDCDSLETTTKLEDEDLLKTLKSALKPKKKKAAPKKETAA